MDTTEDSRIATEHGHESSLTTRTEHPSQSRASSKRLIESLASEAAHVLQSYDEWMEMCEHNNYMDTGDALNQLANLSAMCQRILEEE